MSADRPAAGHQRLRRALAVLGLALLVTCPAAHGAGNVDLPRHPSISPDGSSILFSWRGDLWMVGADGGQARRLTSHPADEHASAWSPDGERIAFESNRAGATGISAAALGPVVGRGSGVPPDGCPPPGWPPGWFFFPRFLPLPPLPPRPVSAFGGLTMSLDGGLELVREFLLNAATVASNDANRRRSEAFSASNSAIRASLSMPTLSDQHAATRQLV